MDFSIVLKNKQVLRGLFLGSSEAPVAIIVLVHGIGEHPRRYSQWAELFSNEGMAMVGVDLP